MAARKYTKEILEPLVAQATSVAGVLRLLGLRPNGGAHAHISRTIKLFEIDTNHFSRYNPARVVCDSLRSKFSSAETRGDYARSRTC